MACGVCNAFPGPRLAISASRSFKEGIATMRYLAIATLAAAVAATGLTFGGPASAQTVDELTVTGRLDGAHARTLSQTVSYADLDLTQYADRERLRLRVNDTARRLCTQLNQQSPNPGNMGHSCQEVAARDALDQVRLAVADARDAAAYADTYGAPVSARVYDDQPPPHTPY
jgi:UrcA family protein